MTLHIGQTLQVQLPAASHWSVVTADTASILTQPTGNGWFDEQLKACVWQFTAVKAGSASLAFAGSALCSPRSPCPQYVIEQSFSVTVDQ